MYIKLYNCFTEDTIINNLEKIADKKIFTPFDHPKTKKPYQ